MLVAWCSLQSAESPQVTSSTLTSNGEQCCKCLTSLCSQPESEPAVEAVPVPRGAECAVGGQMSECDCGCTAMYHSNSTHGNVQNCNTSISTC